jgi:lipoprotein-anchoring transpeptidase ErfK/SrfK
MKGLKKIFFSEYGMRSIFALSLLVSAVSSPAFAQLFQPGYPNPTGPLAAPAQDNSVAPPHYVVPPPHYVVRQSADPAPTQNPNAVLPPAPWNSRGGGLFQGIFGGPTTTVRVYPPLAPGYAFAPAPTAPAAYTSINQGDAADYPIDPKYLRQVVPYPGVEKPGTIIIDTPNKFLDLIEDGGQALRYGIGVGRPGFLWGGVKTITAKREWPDWRPPVEMIARQPDLPRFMPGGVDNPLGARALYLGSSLYRIHGSNEPWTIGTNVSSGCIRMRNEDVIDLYRRVKVGTKVVVI